MTGPEHYRKAEEALAAGDQSQMSGSHERAAAFYIAAQAHATIALAGATALASDEALPDAWYDVLDGPR